MPDERHSLSDIIYFYSKHEMPVILCDCALNVLYFNTELLLSFPSAKEGISIFSLLGVAPFPTPSTAQTFYLTGNEPCLLYPIVGPDQTTYYVVEILPIRAHRHAFMDNTQMGKFLAHLAHEMNTPLSLLCTCLSLIDRHSADATNEKSAHYARMAFHHYYQISRLVSHFSSVSKIYTEGKQALKSRPLNLTQHIGLLCAALKETDNIQGIPVSFVGDDAPCVCRVDPFLTERILLNLLSNAFKYTREGNAITVSVVQKGDHAVIEVTDLGIGMNAKLLKSIRDSIDYPLEPYSALRHGIGLKLVKFYVEIQNGHLEIQSKLGKGSTFRLFFPLDKATASSLKMPHIFDKERFILACQEEFSNIENA